MWMIHNSSADGNANRDQEAREAALAPFTPAIRSPPQPLRGDPERIMLWTQVMSGLEVDELTAVRV